MRKRIPGSERTREALRELVEGRSETEDVKSALLLLSARLAGEEGFEAEVRDALGRDYYEHGAGSDRGYRNGSREGHLKTAEGRLTFTMPQVAGTAAPFRSQLREHLKGHTEALEGLAIEILARGLSVRDIEDAFKDESGRLLLSRTAISETGERLWEDYLAFSSRDLGEYEIAYLFVDGIAERLRSGQKREAVLAAWGFTTEGKKVLLHLMAGSKEDHETVSAFFQDMRARDLGDPLLVVCDGAPGIIKALETCFPRSARQRRLAHRMRNLGGQGAGGDARGAVIAAGPVTRHLLRACLQSCCRPPCRCLAVAPHAGRHEEQVRSPSPHSGTVIHRWSTVLCCNVGSCLQCARNGFLPIPMRFPVVHPSDRACGNVHSNDWRAWLSRSAAPYPSKFTSDVPPEGLLIEPSRADSLGCLPVV